MVSKKAGTSSILQSLWTGPTSIDIPAYMRDAKNGTDIVTSLDVDVQMVAEQKITEAVERFQAESGSVMVTDPKTGMIVNVSYYPKGYKMGWHKNSCGHGMYIIEGAMETNLGIVKKGEFVCPVKYLGKYINGALIVPTRKNLADKGYINFYMAPHTSYYVYKILVFPEYLKNKAS